MGKNTSIAAFLQKLMANQIVPKLSIFHRNPWFITLIKTAYKWFSSKANKSNCVLFRLILILLFHLRLRIQATFPFSFYPTKMMPMSLTTVIDAT